MQVVVALLSFLAAASAEGMQHRTSGVLQAMHKTMTPGLNLSNLGESTCFDLLQ